MSDLEQVQNTSGFEALLETVRALTKPPVFYTATAIGNGALVSYYQSNSREAPYVFYTVYIVAPPHELREKALQCLEDYYQFGAARRVYFTAEEIHLARGNNEQN